MEITFMEMLILYRGVVPTKCQLKCTTAGLRAKLYTDKTFPHKNISNSVTVHYLALPEYNIITSYLH